MLHSGNVSKGNSTSTSKFLILANRSNSTTGTTKRSMKLNHFETNFLYVKRRNPRSSLQFTNNTDTRGLPDEQLM